MSQYFNYLMPLPKLSEAVGYMPAGLDLDTLVAVHVLEWRILPTRPPGPGPRVQSPFDEPGTPDGIWYMPPGWDHPGCARPGYYSTDIGHALPLLNRFWKWNLGNYAIPLLPDKDDKKFGVSALLYRHKDSYWGQAQAPTAALAICRAALLAVLADEQRRSISVPALK